MKTLLSKLRKSKKGFTLVELLVVVAIIGVLMAILIPTVMNFVDNARETAADSGAANIYNTANAYQAQLISLGEEPITDSAAMVTALTTDGYLDATDFTSVTITFTGNNVTTVTVVYKNGTTGYYPRENRSSVASVT